MRPYATVKGVYDSGLMAVGLDRNGRIFDPGALYGIEADVGVYGAKEWKRTRIGLDYQGLYRHYQANTYFNGSDHLLGLDVIRQLTRRSGVSFRAAAGTSSRPVGGVFFYTAPDTQFFGLPAFDLFDNRSYFGEMLGAYTVEMGPRNSIQLGGSGFGVRRQSRVLVEANGYRAFGDFTRRLTRRQSLGVSYSYIHLDYRRVFGEGDVQGLSLNYSRQLSRKWALALSAGVFRTDFAGIRVVELDPVVAELLGRRTGREAFNRINHIPNLLANLTRSFRRSYLSVFYERGMNPGNGVLLLSRQESGGVTYAYNRGRTWAFSWSGLYYESTGLAGFSGQFRALNGGMNASYRLWEGIHLMGEMAARRFMSESTGFRRTGLRLAAGLAYSPGEIPVAIR